MTSDCDFSGSHIIISQQQVCDRAFSCPGVPDKCRCFTCREAQIQILVNLGPFLVAKRTFIEDNIACRVRELYRFFTFLYTQWMIEDFHDAITRDASSAYKMIQLIESADRFIQHGTVGIETDKSTGRHRTLHQEISSIPENCGDPGAGNEVGGGSMDRPSAHRSQSRFLQVDGAGHETLLFARFESKRADQPVSLHMFDQKCV